MERSYWWINKSELEFRKRYDRKISGPKFRTTSLAQQKVKYRNFVQIKRKLSTEKVKLAIFNLAVRYSVHVSTDRGFKLAYVDVLMQTWPQKMKYTTCRTMTYSRYHIQLLELKVCTIDKLFMAFSFLPLKTQFRDFNFRDFRFREFSEEVTSH